MRRWHPIAWIVGTLVVILVILFFLAPSLLSTGWGTRMIARSLSGQIPGRVEIGYLKLRWMGPQTAHDLFLFDPTGKTVATVPTITATASLWSLLWGTNNLGTVTIDHPTVHVAYDKSGGSRLQETLNVACKVSHVWQMHTAGLARSKRDPSFYAGTFHIKQGTIITAAPHLPTVTFSSVELQLVIPPNFENIAASYHSEVNGGEIHMSVDHLRIGASGIVLPGPGFSIQGVARDVPTAGVDALSSLAYPPMLGLLDALVGTPLNAEVSDKGGALFLTATSPHLKLHMQGALQKDQLSLTEPGTASLVMTPKASTKLFPLLPRAEELRLTAPTTLSLTVPTFTATFNKEFEDVQGKGSITLERAQFTHPFVGPFAIEHFGMEGEAKGRGQTALLRGALAVTRQEASGTITTNAETHHFLTSEAHTTFSVNAEQFPTSLVEPIVQHQGIIPALVGPTYSLSLSGESLHDKTTLVIEAESETVALAPTHFAIDEDWIQLTQPSHLGYTLNNRAWQALFGVDSPMHLHEPAKGGIVLNAIRIPRKKIVQPSEVQLVGAFAVPKIEVEGVPGQGHVTLHDLHIRLIGEDVADAHLEAAAELYLPDEAGTWNQVIGDTLPATLQAQVTATPTWTINLPRIVLWLQSRLLSLQGEAALHNFSHLELLSPLALHYTLTPQVLPTLELPADLDFTLEPWKTDLSANWWQTELSGELSVDALTFSGAMHPRIEGFKGHFITNDPRNTARATFSGQTTTVASKDPGTIKGEVTLDHFLTKTGGDLCQSHLKSNITLEKLPTCALALFLNRPDLDTLVGPLTSVLLTTDIAPLAPAQGDVSATIQSDHLHASGGFRLADAISLADSQKPARLRWTLTPEGFAALQKKPGLKLTEATTLEADLTTLNWPLGHATCCAQFDLTARLSDATLTANGGKESARIEDVAITLKAAGTEQPAAFHANGQLTTSGESQKGLFVAHATIGNFLGENGPRNATVDANARVNDLSTLWLLRLLPAVGPLEHPLGLALGERLSGNASAQIAHGQGPISLEIQADRARAHLQGTLKEGVLTLAEPLTGAFQITPELGSVLLQAFNPLLVSTMRSENWATVQIAREGFALPIAPLNLAGLTVGKGTVDLGTLWIARRGTVQHLLRLFPKSHAASQNEIRAWATPAYFSAKGGDIAIERWDLLLDRSVQVASWGNVNLARNSVRLQLAVPGYSLRKVLGLDSIPTDEYLIVPARGTLLETKIDWRKAGARTTAIIARAKGGKPGGAAGVALDLLSGAAKDKREVPPPTTQPFPWAHEVSWPPYQQADTKSKQSREERDNN